MKRLIAVCITVMLVFMLSACGKEPEPQTYEYPDIGFRLTFPASWTGEYRLSTFQDNGGTAHLSISTELAGTLFFLHRETVDQWNSHNEPSAPFRILAQTEQYVYIQVYVSDVQYDIRDKAQTRRYQRLWADMDSVLIEILE